jgi:hypothetical protein
MGFDIGNILKKAVKVVAPAALATVTGPAALILYDKKVSAASGRAIGQASAVVDKGATVAASAIQKIPVIGPVYHAQLVIASRPFAVAENILRGKNISQSALVGLRQAVAAAREEAPMAQAVISFVPGVGPLASSAIGAGLALAEGLPMDEVAMAAVAGAIPGGALAQAAYNVGRTAVVNHKVGDLASLVSAAGAAAGVTVPPAAAAALSGGLHTLQAVANGQRPDVAVMNAAFQAAPGLAQGINFSSPTGSQDAADGLISKGQSMIPLSDDQRKAFGNALKIGIAVQHASNLQKATQQDIAKPQEQARVAAIGQKTMDPVSTAARNSLQGNGVNGFDVGHGLLQNVVTPFEVSATRNALSAPDRHGFDVAATLHTGRVIAPPPPPAVPAAAQAGYAIVHGAAGAPAAQQAAINPIANTRDGATGVRVALAELKKYGLAADIGIVAIGALLGALFSIPTGLFIGVLAGGAVDLIRRQS